MIRRNGEELLVGRDMFIFIDIVDSFVGMADTSQSVIVERIQDRRNESRRHPQQFTVICLEKITNTAYKLIYLYYLFYSTHIL